MAAANRRVGGGPRKPRAIDLFAGCGGLTQGLKDAGFRVIGAVEINELAAEAYHLNHPEVRLWEEDIRTLSCKRVKTRLRLEKGRLELLAGCPPCQGFSSLRTLNGARVVKDARNHLITDFLRFVRVLAPRAIMFENVPGLATKQRFKRFLARLAKLGYKLNWAVLDAAEFGVPQRRRRLILLGSKRAIIRFGVRGPKQYTVEDAIGSLPHPRHSPDPHHKSGQKRSERIRKLIALIPQNGGSRTDLSKRYWLKCHKECDGFKDVYGRMKWADVAPTITGGFVNPSKGRFLHPTQRRPITVREAALLQSFRRRYKFPTGRGAYPVAELIGNALPPEFIRRHAVRVRAHLRLPARCA